MINIVTENELTNRLVREHTSVADVINIEAIIAAVVAIYRFKDQGVYVVQVKDVHNIERRVTYELDALQWIHDNPVSALRAIVDNARRSSDDLGELDVALATLAASYEAWADGLPLPLDVEGQPYREARERIAGARAKARRLRDLAKALEVFNRG